MLSKIISTLQKILADMDDPRARKDRRTNIKNQLTDLGVEVLGNYVRKGDIKRILAVSTMTLWHGGNLEYRKENVSHKKGRWEFGPGLYLTTHYGTATKYAKGSRKLYKITIEKGVDVKDVNLPIDIVLDFIDTYVVKAKRKEIQGRIEKWTKNDAVPANTFLNIMVNENAIKNTDTDKLRIFLVTNGIDYSVENSAFGWGEKMVVLFNMDKIVSKTIITSKDKIEVFDLPTDFN